MTIAEDIDARLQVWSAGPADKNSLAVLLKGLMIPAAANVGVGGGAGLVATEQGNDISHQTRLVLTAFVMPAIPGGASLAIGKNLYTFPAGDYIIESAYFSLAVNGVAAIQANTPNVALGTVIGSGAVATLAGTATFMDIITQQLATNANGSVTAKSALPTAGVPLVVPAASPHSLFLNLAAAWSAGGDPAPKVTGTVIVNWRKYAP